jgi:hypothetical protein
MTLEQIRSLPGVARVNAWNDRIYINIRGNGGNFAGERSTKVWISATGDLTIERGRGTITREFDANLQAFVAAYNVAR